MAGASTLSTTMAKTATRTLLQLTRFLLAGSALALGACGHDQAPIASLSLGLSDAPVDDAQAVVVSIAAVELLDAQGDVAQRIEFDPATPVDLLQQQGGAQFLLFEDRAIPAGTYPELRLIVASRTTASCSQALADPDHPSYVAVDGVEHPLIVPSGGSAGLRLRGPIVVEDDREARYTIDFDLRKSIVERGRSGCYNLKPRLRLIDDSTSGAVAGRIDAALLSDAGCTADPADGSGAAVYVFAGDGIEPDDDDGTAPDPLTTALLTPIVDGGVTTFRYAAGFLPAGTYTVAFSCQAGDDVPASEAGSDDPIAFTGAATVTVEAGATTTHDFDGAAPP
jgi:hypothetical protein